MNNIIFYAASLSFASYVLLKLFGSIARKLNWRWWYRHCYLNSPHWKFTRWKKKFWMMITIGRVWCEKCGSTQRLQIHHITYSRIGHERMDDLQVICSKCHRRGGGRI